MRSGYFVEWRHLSGTRWREAGAGGQERQLSARIIVAGSIFLPYIYCQIVSTLKCRPLHNRRFSSCLCWVAGWPIILISSNHHFPISTFVSKSSLPRPILLILFRHRQTAEGVKIEPTDDKWADLGAGAALLMGKKVISARRPASSPTFTLFAWTGCFSEDNAGRIEPTSGQLVRECGEAREVSSREL